MTYSSIQHPDSQFNLTQVQLVSTFTALCIFHPLLVELPAMFLLRHSIGGTKTLTIGIGYDDYGRVNRETFPTGYYTENHYDDYGILYQVTDNHYPVRVIWQATQANARAQITRELKGAKETIYGYDESKRGLLTGITATGINYFTLSYEDTNKPHKLTSIGSHPEMIPNTNLSVSYTDFRKIQTISEPGKNYTVSYGVDEQRRKTVYTNETATVTRYYFGNYEEESDNIGNNRKFHYLSGGAVLININGVETLYYGYADNQGSLFIGGGKYVNWNGDDVTFDEVYNNFVVPNANPDWIYRHNINAVGISGNYIDGFKLNGVLYEFNKPLKYGEKTDRVMNPSGQGGNSLYAIGMGLNAAGFVSSAGEYSNVINGSWKGVNGKWDSLEWGGNQWTGARANALSKAGYFKLASRGFFVVGTGISLYQGGDALLNGNYAGAAKSGLDIGMGAFTTFGGPPGWIIGGGYFALDALGAFDRPMITTPYTPPMYAVPDNTYVAPPVIFSLR